jgi:hypothetical protein
MLFVGFFFEANSFCLSLLLLLPIREEIQYFMLIPKNSITLFQECLKVAGRVQYLKYLIFELFIAATFDYFHESGARLTPIDQNQQFTLFECHSPG